MFQCLSLFSTFAFYFVHSVIFLLFSVLFCVLFLPKYLLVYSLFVYKFTDHCHGLETQLQYINITNIKIFNP